jgi:uncharacterized protein YprB with RNaseH-like and TPR domain
MEDDLGRKLRRLGVVKGARNLKHAPPRSRMLPDDNNRWTTSQKRSEKQESGDVTVLLPGAYIAENELGACLVLDHVYPSDYQHGHLRLGDLLEQSTDAPSTFYRDSRLAEMAFEDFLFLDTETTGLMGAGTFAFMVGIAFIERDEDQTVFVVRQYFLRDQADEPAMLLFLAGLLEERPGLITFNGRTFDLPLLDNRYVMNRLDALIGVLPKQPHIDLLPPSRRLWRKRIGSCSLASLEKRILGLTRTQEDVPGWMIPGMYMDYLRSRDATELLRVFYHNRIDMLSMVVLAALINRHIDEPNNVDDPLDLVSLAMWQNTLGMSGEAESTLRLAADKEMPLEHYHLTWRELGQLLKRAGRRNEAAIHWQQIAVTHVDGMTPGQTALEAHVELAMYHEWHQRDLKEARSWTQQAITLVDGWGAARFHPAMDELRHRLARLERKIDREELTD